MPELPKMDSAIRRLQTLPDQVQTEYRDSRTPGLSLLVGKKARTWFLTYMAPDGKRKRLKLGRYPAVGLATARERSEGVFRDLHERIDPSQARKAYRESPTVAEAAEQYLVHYASRKVTKAMDSLVLNGDVIPEIGSRKLVDVSKRDVQAVLRRVMNRGAGHLANRTLSVLRQMLTWSVEQGWIETNAAVGVSMPYSEKPRSRVLSESEIEALWAALDSISAQSRTAFKLLLLTGQREMEVIGMRWSEIDLAKGIWTLPADEAGRSKSRTAPHVVPLSSPVAEMLAGMPRREGSEHVFLTNPNRGRWPAPTRGIVREGKVRLDDVLGFTEPWRIHDLRRTMRTGLSQLAVPPHIAELIIGHAAGGIVKVYDRYDYLPEKREALQRWSDHLLTIVGERPERHNVVALKEGAAQ